MACLEGLKADCGYERNVASKAMGWRRKDGWDDVEANAVVTEGVRGVGIEGGIVVADPVLGNLVTPKYIHRINLTNNQLKGTIPSNFWRVTQLQTLHLLSHSLALRHLFLLNKKRGIPCSPTSPCTAARTAPPRHQAAQ